MKHQRRTRIYVISVLLLALGASLTGCQIVSPRVPSPSPTTILLPLSLATVQPTPLAGATAVTPTKPAAATPKQAETRFLPQTTSTGATADGMMAVGLRANIILRAEPATGAKVIANVPGSRVLRAQGRTRDGGWVLVVDTDTGRQGWVAAKDVKLMGDVVGLAEIEPVSANALATSPSSEAAVGVATALPTRRPANTAPLSGKIVFQTAIGGDIYLVNAGGAGLRRLTDGIDPVLSPDGKQIAFARWAAPHGIFVLDLRTGAERRVATANRPRGPAWSPDGSQIAFSPVVATDVCLVSPFGCLDEATLRARFGGQDCLETPFGRTCIQDYPERSVELTGIVLIDANGENWQDVASATDAQAISWRPGSDELLYRGAGGLQLAAPGAAPRSVVQDPAFGSPAWSPDGARIAVQMRLHDHFDILLLDASGTRLTRLTAPSSTTGRAPNNVAPTWSPDGKSLLFLSDRDGAWRLYRMNTDGSGQAPFLPIALKDIRFTYDFAAERVVSWGR